MSFREALIGLGARPYVLSVIITSLVVGTQQCGTETTGPGGAGGSGAEAGAGGEGGDGGTAGEGGSGGETSSGGGGTGGAGGAGAQGGGGAGGCEPVADPCGDAACGVVDDGCGHTVTCAICAAGVCVDNACCQPKTCADFPGACGGAELDDGCGGTLTCGDAVCGDGQWMTCQASACACPPATDFPNAQQSQDDCDELHPGTKARYCGAIDTEVPADCEWTAGANGGVAGNPGIWCCP